MKLCALGLAVLLASTFALPTALAAEHYAGLGLSGEPHGVSQSSTERVGSSSAGSAAALRAGSARSIHSGSSGAAAFSLGFAGCSTHAGAPARDTVTLAALGAVVLLVVRRLLQASS
jgi:hypothetical protein